jgi:hypothetical protein
VGGDGGFDPIRGRAVERFSRNTFDKIEHLYNQGRWCELLFAPRPPAIQSHSEVSFAPDGSGRTLSLTKNSRWNRFPRMAQVFGDLDFHWVRPKLSCRWATPKKALGWTGQGVFLIDVADWIPFGVLSAIPTVGRLGETTGGCCVVSGLLSSS